MDKAKVFFTKEISPESLQKIYEALGVTLYGKIGVKVSTGEDGAKGYLKADLIGPFVKNLNGTIIECNTAYGGARNKASDHLKVAEKHGFTSFAEVDIMDADGDKKSPSITANISNTTSLATISTAMIPLSTSHMAKVT